MDDQIQVSKLSATSLLLLWSGWFLSQIAQSLLADIPNPFYEQVGALLGYKRLLNICLFLLIAVASLLILYFSKHVNRKESSSDNATNPATSGEQEKINALQNLTPLEQRRLNNFVKAKTLILKDSDITALTFLKDKLIEDLGTDAYSRKIYKIDNFVLAHLKAHPDLLEQTVESKIPKEKTIISEPLFEPTFDEQKSLMEYLSTSEKQFLSQFINIDNKFIGGNANDPTGNALTAKKIIYIRHEASVRDISGKIAFVEFVLYEWTWKYLKEHPDVLEKGLTGLTQRQKLLVVYLEEQLSEGEKEILRTPILDVILLENSEKRIVWKHRADPFANLLAKANILIPLAEDDIGQKQYQIDEFVVSYLTEHPQFLR